MNTYFSVTFTCIKNDKFYQFVVPIGAPYEDANAAALELAQAVLDMQAQAIKNAESESTQSQEQPIQPEIDQEKPIESELVS